MTKIRNAEADVIDAIDELVDDQMARGQYGRYSYCSTATFEACRWCRLDFHGEPTVSCPGSTAEGPLPAPEGYTFEGEPTLSVQVSEGNAVYLGDHLLTLPTMFYGVVDDSLESLTGTLVYTDQVMGVTVSQEDPMRGLIAVMQQAINCLCGLLGIAPEVFDDQESIMRWCEEFIAEVERGNLH